jgi:DNA (cytosine-5)-methyltransferase 1
MPDKDNFNAVIQPIAIDMGGGKSSVDIHTDRSPTLTTTHYGEPAVVYDARGNGDGTVAPTMTGDHQNRVTDYTGVIVSLDRASFNQGKNAKYDFEVSEEGINSHIVAKGPSAVAYAVDARNGTEDVVNGSLQSNSAHSLNGNNVVRVKYIVRRLTPLECERLQGFPDRWTDIGEFTDTKGKRCKTSDASRYKALGNSIALPSWKWVLKRLCATYERDATMASLFDGIGGFPHLWEQINGKGSCLWASEIEEFPIAVTKERI